MNDTTSPSPGLPAATAAPQTAPTSSPTPPVAAPEGPIAVYWDAEKGTFKTDELAKEFTTLHAAKLAQDERAKAIPAKPEEYKLELPKDFQVPQGVEVKFDLADPVRGPILTEALKFAHDVGLPQDKVSHLLGLQAKLQLAETQRDLTAHQEMVKAETVKLGGDEPAKQRKGAIETFAKANLADDEQQEVRLLLATEAGVRALEKIIGKANGTRMPGNVPQDPPKPAPKTFAEVMYPNQPSGLPPASARSA